MREFSVKKAVLGGISALAALMMLLAFCFTLTTGTNAFGMAMNNPATSDNGFTMLDFSSNLITTRYQWGAVLIGSLCYLQLFVALTLLILNIVGVFCLPRRASDVISLATAIIAVMFNLLYMTEGIVFSVICNNTYAGGMYSTFAYLPLVFTVLIAIAFFVCKFAIKEPQKTADAADTASAE